MIINGFLVNEKPMDKSNWKEKKKKKQTHTHTPQGYHLPQESIYYLELNGTT